MAKERALDIFFLLEQIDRKNYDIWNNLTDEQKKEFSPLVVTRWMAGTTDPLQLIFLNELVNPIIYNLPNHKDLILKLLTVCSSGKPKRYSWINYKISKAKKQSMILDLISKQYNFSMKEAEEVRSLFNDEEILELAYLQGLQKEEISLLKKELK